MYPSNHSPIYHHIHTKIQLSIHQTDRDENTEIRHS